MERHRSPMGTRGSLATALLALLALSGSGCARITNAYVGTPIDERGQLMAARATPSGLVVSAEENTTYASDLFGLIEVTLENQSSAWLQIDELTLDFGSAEKNAGVYLPDAAQIDAWYLATAQRNDIRHTNAATTLDALLFVGTAAAVAGSATGLRKVAAVGAAAALGSVSADAAAAEGDRVEHAERIEPLPDAHLLAVPFAIPPHLFAKKWVLLNTRSSDVPCIRSLLLAYDVKGRGLERVSLPFRSRLQSSEWQRRACRATIPTAPTAPTGAAPRK